MITRIKSFSTRPLFRLSEWYETVSREEGIFFTPDRALLLGRIAVLIFGLAACIWQTAFWLFIVLYALVAILVLKRKTFLYRPATVPIPTPREIGLDRVSALDLRAHDGENILAWRADPQPGLPVLLYFHGQKCNLANRKERIQRITRSGYGFLMPSFRGYGLSSGEPSEENNVADGLGAYDYLIEQGYSPDEIVIYGESLGTGVATQVAAQRRSAAVILESPFTSLKAVIREKFSFLPVDVFLEEKYESVRFIRAIRSPLLVIHAVRDKVVPFGQGRALFEAAVAPKNFLSIENAGHTGLFRAGAWRGIRRFLDDHVHLSPSTTAQHPEDGSHSRQPASMN